MARLSGLVDATALVAPLIGIERYIDRARESLIFPRSRQGGLAKCERVGFWPRGNGPFRERPVTVNLRHQAMPPLVGTTSLRKNSKGHSGENVWTLSNLGH